MGRGRKEGYKPQISVNTEGEGRGISMKTTVEEYKKIYGDIGTHKSIASIINYEGAEKKVPMHTVSFVNNRFKSFLVVHGQIGQCLPVDFDFILFQEIDQSGI